MASDPWDALATAIKAVIDDTEAQGFTDPEAGQSYWADALAEVLYNYFQQDAQEFNLSDDAATTLTPPAGSGVLVISEAGRRAAGVMFRQSTGETEVLYQDSEGVFNAITNTSLGGTTGADSSINISAHSGGVDVENRLGGSASFSYSWTAYR